MQHSDIFETLFCNYTSISTPKDLLQTVTSIFQSASKTIFIRKWLISKHAERVFIKLLEAPKVEQTTKLASYECLLSLLEEFGFVDALLQENMVFILSQVLRNEEKSTEELELALKGKVQINNFLIGSSKLY